MTSHFSDLEFAKSAQFFDILIDLRNGERPRERGGTAKERRKARFERGQ